MRLQAEGLIEVDARQIVVKDLKELTGCWKRAINFGSAHC